MIDFDFNNHCSGCSVCSDACPKKSIRMTKNRWDFSVPFVDTASCIDCHICESVCPVLNVKISKSENKALYCAFNKNNDDRMKGSSGSIMLAFAKHVLSKKGVVYGAAFNEKLEVVHTRATCLEEVEKQCKSKYVQSKTEGIYSSVKEDLTAGKNVLFVGTPCQVQALNNYLRDRSKYPNLILFDFLCHGVPSQALFSKSIKQYESVHDCKVIDFNFREKVKGYPHNFRMTIKKNDGKLQTIVGRSDEFPYYCGYRRYYAFRESCYECKFTGADRVSDFTIGDFWGLQNNEKYSDFYEKGYSMLYVNTSRGHQILDALTASVHLEEFSPTDKAAQNFAYLKPTHKSIIHNWFMKDYLVLDYPRLEKRYFSFQRSLIQKIIVVIILKLRKYGISWL